MCIYGADWVHITPLLHDTVGMGSLPVMQESGEGGLVIQGQ